MAIYCERCGKGVQRIMLVSHAKNRSHRGAKPNLHWYRLKIDGETVRMRLCIKCGRIIKEGIKSQLEAMKKKTEGKQSEVLEKVKKKRDEKMEKKEVEQKVRKARSEAKRQRKEITSKATSK